MSIPRFYCPVPLRNQQHVELPEATSHYIGRVLRLREGANIVLFDGHGGHYVSQIRYQAKRVMAQVGTFHDHDAELPGRIRVVQALASADKMDWIIEKAVELGVANVAPVAARHSVLQLRGERLEKRLRHWRRVAQSASEQCGRNTLMTIDAPSTLEQVLQRLTPEPGAITLLGDPEAGIPLSQTIQDAQQQGASTSMACQEINLLIGPEGGWSAAEREQAKNHGARMITFGTRVLRTETAGIALVAACVALLGWDTK